MVNIIDRPPSFGEQMGKALGGGFGGGFSKGIDFAQQLKLEKQKSALKKKEEDVTRFSTGLDTIAQMRSILQKGNLGRGSGIMGMFGGETAKDREAFAQYGRSLIPLVAAGVPIRNLREFEEYKKIITDPSALQSEIEGALDALEDVFSQKVAGKSAERPARRAEKEKPGFEKFETGTQGYKRMQSEKKSLQRVKPGTDLTLDVVKTLVKKTGGNEEKALQLAKELGYNVD